MPEKVEIFEVGPRDGLQNEKAVITAQQKVELVDMLSDCGFQRIEMASFVSPKWVPQMASSGAVLAGINRRAAVRYAALVPNMRGFENAVAAQADEVAIFAAASEGFSKANINCSIEESFARFAPIVEAAKKVGLPVRGYISCVTDCPYEGVVAPDQVARVAAHLAKVGCYEISLGDTIGRGTPAAMDAMLSAVLEAAPAEQLAGHFHDTAGLALQNIEVSLERGLRVFDAAVGGLGGCPYAPGAAGNVATERVAALLADLGYQTGLDLVKVQSAAAFAKSLREPADV